MLRRTFLVTSALGLVAACAPGGAMQQADPRPVMQRSYDLRELRFAAREGLIVSEENSFYPMADIVWRGDPPGPRLAQIETMFQEAARRSQPVLNGSTPVVVDVVLIRFHGVTTRTRTTVGGVYNVIFDLSVRDAQTGAIIEPPRRVVGNLSAPGGARAAALIDAGQTERVRVTDFLTALLRQQLA